MMEARGEVIHILHVDDEPNFADMAATFLEREVDRFSIETATSASEGLDQLAEAEFDCIVSDYDMPGQNGIEFLEAVREEYPDLPFILYTGQGSEEVASEAISNGATDYLQKEGGSGHYELLANRIKNAVEQYQSNRKAANLERIRQLVSDTNQALVRATSPKEIENQVCQLISDSNTYVTACIADVDRETMEIEPRTWAGDAAGYFEELDMTVDEESPGRHAPGGRAFHDREIAVSQDIQDDDRYATWREAALKRGFQSLAVVPIEYEDELHGLLATFASRPNAFDQTERELLAELADDTGHALHGQQTQTELEWEQGFINQALNALNDLFYIIGTDGNLRRWNEQVTEVFGYSDDELGEMKAPKLLPEDERSEITDAITETLTTGGAVVEAEILTADGERIPYELTGKRLTDPDGDLIGVIGIGREVTERKEREQEQEQRYEAIFNQSYQFVGLIDPDGTLLEANETALEFGGVKEKDVVGEKFWEAPWWQASEETQQELHEAIDRAADGEFVRYNVEVQGEDEIVTIDFSIRPVTDENGDVIYLIPEGRNITELKSLRQREEELERQNERLERFASVVSHDLRNPLRVADGRLELAREECDSGHLDDAADAVDRSLTLIDDLLTLAREGKEGSEVEPVDISEMVEGCWKTIQTKDATLVTETDRTIRADESRLEQVLENLIGNAVEHGGEDVTITTGDLDDGFYIIDDGPGIPEDEREQVFEAGYSTADDGTGLGLNIAKEIAEAHGWEISVTESETGGARFEITGVEFVT